MRNVTRTLLCMLTDSEKVHIGDSLVSKMKEIDIVEGDKRAAVAEHNAKLKELRKEKDRLFKAYDVGAEEREVACREEPGENGTIRVYRIDTGEWLQDPRAGAEKQLEIPLARPGKACQGCGNVDGTHHPSCAASEVVEPAAEVAPSTPAPKVAKPDEPRDHVGVGLDKSEYPITASEHRKVQKGKTLVLDAERCGTESGVEIVLSRAPASEEHPATVEDEIGPDEEALAALADEQLANGDAPELEVDAALAEGKPLPKPKRGRPTRKAAAAEAE